MGPARDEDNLVIHLLSGAFDHPERHFLIDGNRCWTYGDTLSRVRRMATVLTNSGARPGDRVVVQVEKSPDAVALYLACLWTGTVHVPLNPTFTEAERAYFIADADPSVVVVDPSRVAAPTKATDQEWLTLDPAGRGSLAGRADGSSPLTSPVPRGDNDLAAILYTSGTTGQPKGAALTHANLKHNADTLHRSWRFGPEDHLVHALPIFHVHGLFVALHCAMLSTIPVAFLPRFDPDTVIDNLAQSTVFMGVPTHYRRLCNSPRLTRDSTASMRLFTCGSAPLSSELAAEFSATTGHSICERYGMSETGITVSNPYDGERIAGTIGYPLTDTEVKVVDDSGHGLPVGSVGTLAVRSPSIMKGYWRRPEATEQSFTGDGWFLTGDIASQDDDGRLTLHGRESDMIISGGENIYPKEIETALDSIDGVTESAVIGLPHDDLGEQVVAIVVCTDSGLGESRLREALAQKLARFKQPRHFEIVDSLPRNSMGKVQKNLLRDRYSTVG